MIERIKKMSLPPMAGLIAGAIVALGVLLWMFVSKSLIIVAAIGVFGPGILRELGWLKDHDEFQRQAAHRAGYHAYLIGGLAAAIVLSVHESSTSNGEESAEWIRFIVLVLWISWMFSALISYWGARKTASAVLMTFGAFWAVFVLAHLFGESNPDVPFWQAVLGFFVGTTLIAAFFVPAWTAYKWPRPTGVALLILSVVFIVVFGRTGGLSWSTVALTQTMLLGPLIVSGIALLKEGNSDMEDDPMPDEPNGAKDET